MLPVAHGVVEEIASESGQSKIDFGVGDAIEAVTLSNIYETVEI